MLVYCLHQIQKLLGLLLLEVLNFLAKDLGACLVLPKGSESVLVVVHGLLHGSQDVTRDVVPSQVQLPQGSVAGETVHQSPAPQEANVIPAQVQLLEGGVALQGQGQFLCSLVTDLVVSEVQLPQGTIGCQTPTEGGKGIFPRAKVVPLQREALNRLVLSKELSQSLSSCSSEVVAL